MSQPIVLPADVYDTLEFSALVYGGIGQGCTLDKRGRPLCAAGHCSSSDPDDSIFGQMLHQLRMAAGHGVEGPIGDWNDSAFQRDEKRIPFAEWCRRLNVVRGA